MLARDSSVYLVARLVAGGMNFATIVLLTRYVTPFEYGRFGFALALAGFLGAVFFQWIRLGLLRHGVGDADNGTHWRAALWAFGAIGLVVLLGGGGALALAGDAGWLYFAGSAFLVSTGWFELVLDSARRALRPWRYCAVTCSRAVVAFFLMGLAAYFGRGAAALLAMGCLASVLVTIPALLSNIRSGLGALPKNAIRSLMTFGLPASTALSVTLLAGVMERGVLGWRHSSGEVGMYVAAVDLTQQCIGLLMMAVNLAAYPLAVREYERGGIRAAGDQLERNGVLLVGIGLPAVVGLIQLRVEIAELVFGPDFRALAAELIPLVAVTALFSGLRAYWSDLAFQLSRALKAQLLTAAIVPAVSAAMLACLISRGPFGVAVSAAVASAIAFFVSWYLGRSRVPLSIPLGDFLGIVGSVVAMAAVIHHCGRWPGPLGLIAQITLGASTYAAGIVATNVGRVRTGLGRRLGWWASQG